MFPKDIDALRLPTGPKFGSSKGTGGTKYLLSTYPYARGEISITMCLGMDMKGISCIIAYILLYIVRSIYKVRVQTPLLLKRFTLLTRTDS
jgi:hypothetical protein